MVVNLRWIKTLSITLQYVDFYWSLVCATIILFWNKNCPIIGEHGGVNFLAQCYHSNSMAY